MDTRRLPDVDRISVLSATILLAYAMARFVDLPGRTVTIDLLAFFLIVEINTNTVVALLVAGITASGADWLIRSHPGASAGNTIQYWVLPGLTAWVLGVTLNALRVGVLWWIVFMIGAGLLIMVLVAEYIVVDPNDLRFPIAAGALTAVSFALYLILAITLRSLAIRLLLLIPALSIPGSLICVRFINLRLQINHMYSRENIILGALAALTVGVILTQVTTGFHYWSLSPIAFGLALLAPAYGLTNFFGNLIEGMSSRRSLVEPVLFTTLLWAAALLVP